MTACALEMTHQLKPKDYWSWTTVVPMGVMHTDHSPTQRILDTLRFSLYLLSFGLLNS